MKICLNLFFVLLLHVTVSAQDTTYFDLKSNKVESLEMADNYLVITVDSIGRNARFEATYYKSGALLSEVRSLKMPNKYEKNGFYWAKIGTYKSKFENGKLSKEIEYKDGKYNGKLITYWENGAKKRIDTFRDGEFVEGQCFDSIGQTIEHFPYDQMPQFPGGEKELFLYLAQNIRYPDLAQRSAIQGRVIAGFTVDTEGNLEDLKIAKSVDEDLDAEALRVIRHMPKWVPGLQDGKLVRVNYSLPVNFRLK